MIGFFPNPYPDELFYSMCARYSESVHYTDLEHINSELFGSRHIAASIEFPYGLTSFVARLPEGHKFTVDRLINNHTLFPFYAPFLPYDRVKRIRHNMSSSRGLGIHSATGNNYNCLKPPLWLRFCPTCVKEDRSYFGECYWHRLHQVLGVMVCPAHQVFLENSDARIRDRVNSRLYISAQQASPVCPPRRLDLSVPEHQILLDISENIVWLLSNHDLAPGTKSIHSCYLQLLAEKGLISKTGKIFTSEFIKAVKGYYSSGLLKLLQCSFKEHRFTRWPYRLITNLKRNITNHPLRHLLLIKFLGQTDDSFFTTCSSIKPKRERIIKEPFGKGPWPCLNPASDHYHQMTIKECHVTRRNKKMPIGTFQCACGFSYSRRGPDVSTQGQYRIGWIRSYGSAWELALRKMWQDTSLSLREIARQLSTQHLIIKLQAMRLGLAFPRIGPGPGSKMAKAISSYKVTHSEKPDLRKPYRRKWIATIDENPAITRTAIRQQLPQVYYWLNKYDGEWLKSHQPARYKRHGPAIKIDWESRDALTANEVRLAALQIKGFVGRPVRVTVKAICRHLTSAKFWQIRKYATKLPLTIRALTNVVESRIEFAIRRIHWVTHCFRQEGVSFPKYKLAMRAGVECTLARIPEIKAVLDSAWLSLQQPNVCSDVNAA